ncbi:MAG: hypothetical protein ABJB61_06740 [bacterium]
MANGGDIIIRGGSVDIDYDADVYKPVMGSSRNHKTTDHIITRVTVEYTESGGVQYDSQTESPTTPPWRIHVYCTKPTGKEQP